MNRNTPPRGTRPRPENTNTGLGQPVRKSGTPTQAPRPNPTRPAPTQGRPLIHPARAARRRRYYNGRIECEYHIFESLEEEKKKRTAASENKQRNHKPGMRGGKK